MSFSHCSSLSAFLLPINETITSNLRTLTASALLLSAITTSALVLNVTIILAVLRSWFTAYYKITSQDNISPQILMLSMAVIGLLYGLLVMPMGVLEVVHNGEWSLGAGFCSARFVCNQLLGTSFMLHVMCLSIERYIAIHKPLKYRMMTYKTGVVLASSSWLLSSLVTSATQIVKQTQADVKASVYNTSLLVQQESTVFTDKTFTLAYFLFMNSPFFVSYFLYGLILLEVYRFKKRTLRRLNAKHVNEGQESTRNNGICYSTRSGPQIPALCHIDTVSCISEANSPSSVKKLGTQKSERIVAHQSSILKAVRTVGFIMISYTLCWLPGWLYLTCVFHQGESMTMWSEAVVLWVTYINSVLNPVVCCTYKPISKAVSSLFGT